MITQEEFSKLPKEQQETLLKKLEEVQAITKSISKADEPLPKMSMPDFKGMIEETVKQHIQSMTPVDRKYFAFPGIGKVNDDVSPEGKFAKTTKFLKALIGADVSILRDMHNEVRTKANLSEGSTTAGGYLVPEEFRAEVLRVAAIYGVIRRECRMIPMQFDVINIPAAGTTDQSAIWTSEAAAIKQTNPSFRQVTLTINKLGAIPKVTNELLNDANIQVVNYLAELIGWAFAKAEDASGFGCDGGSPFVGALLATGVPTSAHAGGTAAQSLSYQDLINATGNIYTNLQGNAKFYFHRSMGAHIRGLITTAGAPLFGSTAQEIAGFPLVLAEALPLKTSAVAASTAYAIFGDLRQGIAMGERGSITMKLSEEATVDSDNLFEKDMAALRMIERIAIGVLLPSAFTTIVTAAA